VKRHGTARQTTDGNKTRRMRIACWINKATAAHSRLFNNYYFSTETMVLRKGPEGGGLFSYVRTFHPLLDQCKQLHTRLVHSG